MKVVRTIDIGRSARGETSVRSSSSTLRRFDPTSANHSKEHVVRVAYLYFMAPNPERVGPVVPRHVAYWHELRLAGYEGGPFADRSGGLILFEAESIATARAIANADPFALEGLLADAWVKEWRAETSSPVRRP